MNAAINKSVDIYAPLEMVWEYLSRPALMKVWTGEPEMKIDILTSLGMWQPNDHQGFSPWAFRKQGPGAAV